MLNKKKNNKQEKLKQTQRTGLLFFIYMLVLFAGLTLVACPDGSTSGSPESSGMTDTTITTVAQLKAIANDLGATYNLESNIDISGAAWTPLGDITTPFTGTLHGNGYTITGLTIGSSTTSAGNYQGLFGVIEGATIDNLFIEVKHIYANAAVGALVGMVQSTNNSTSTLTNIAVSGMNTSAIIQATGSVKILKSFISPPAAYLGGVVGYLDYTAANIFTGQTSTTDPRHTISAYNYGLKVKATSTSNFSSVGGVVGYARTSDIMGYATGAVSGTTYVGGVVGYARTSDIMGYATGAVSGINYVGGQVGDAISSIVTGYATGAVSGINYVGGQVGKAIKDSTVSGYATGVVSGTTYVGGQVGDAISSIVTGYATGDVSALAAVGGQVGLANVSTVSGYARGTVTRKSGTYTNFGMLMGANSGSTVSGFHSATESTLLDSDGTAATGTTGTDGTAITMGEGIKQATFSLATGDTLTFGTAVGQWTWVANGQWPAINIGSLGGDSASDKQPTK